MQRSSGIIMPIFSLPSPYGIGTFGAAAREWVDFLSAAGQAWWQVLPATITAYGNSPYSSPSALAGNPLFIDLDLLVEDGLLTKREVSSRSWGEDPARVDYDQLNEKRPIVLQRAFERGYEQHAKAVEAFRAENEAWIADYALFMALKERYDGADWREWPDEALRMHEQEACAKAAEELEERMNYYVFVQYLFFKQWNSLREYAHEKGVGIIGDIPIYVALDSVDVWSQPQYFQLDEKHEPVEVAGVPPDYFSEDGQLWGNPLYDYDAMQKDGWGWWIRRIGGAGKLYDVIRIDHFRGFESYWSVPASETTAKNGHWVKGPGMDLLHPVLGWFQHLQYIAEDLGDRTPAVDALLEDSELPGMKVLEFAFDGDYESDYMPHRYTQHCVCYTGTHDNDTIMGWYKHTSKQTRARAAAYLGLSKTEGYNWGVIRGGMSSVAELFMAQMQDYLGLGSEARMNTPGTVGGNWEWRMLPGSTTEELASKIATMTKLYGRSAH